MRQRLLDARNGAGFLDQRFVSLRSDARGHIAHKREQHAFGFAFHEFVCDGLGDVRARGDGLVMIDVRLRDEAQRILFGDEGATHDDRARNFDGVVGK